MARQVNHDIKNGLTPLRNVFRHLTQVSRENPGELPGVLRAREGTIESGLTYLENLASDYARISRRGERRPCDVAEIARTVARDRHGTDGATVHTDASVPAVVHGDPMALRRVLENLVDNAIESLETGRGDVTISVVRVDDGGEGARVRVAVSDTGRGMTEEERAHAFDDFYTTREDGTGLGLSIVRRLVMDLEGSIDVHSEPGRGSTFTIEIPAAATGEKE
jgi:two-component system nitrogen regulation sensor histidine kinase NtrY